MPQVTFSVPRGQQSRVSVLCNSVFVKNEWRKKEKRRQRSGARMPQDLFSLCHVVICSLVFSVMCKSVCKKKSVRSGLEHMWANSLANSVKKNIWLWICIVQRLKLRNI
jgi:hypothetical protein